MKCNVLVHKEIEIKPGDRVVVNINWGEPIQKRVHVKRVVENRYGAYVVFDNCTWRPLSTHGITWEKVS